MPINGSTRKEGKKTQKHSQSHGGCFTTPAWHQWVRRLWVLGKWCVCVCVGKCVVVTGLEDCLWAKGQQWPSVWDNKTRVLISVSRCVCVHMWVICYSRGQVLVTYAQQRTIICWRGRKMEIWELCERGKNSLKNEQQQKTPKTTPPKKEVSIYESWFCLLAHLLIFSKASLRVNSPAPRRCTGNYGTVMETALNQGENDPSWLPRLFSGLHLSWTEFQSINLFAWKNDGMCIGNI